MKSDPDDGTEDNALVATMYSVLSETNEALLYAPDPRALYQRVCDAAILGPLFMSAAVAIPDTNSDWVKVAASAGWGKQQLENARISVSDSNEEGHGLVGMAVRTCKPCVSHDFQNDERTRIWHSVAAEVGVHSGAAVPFVHDGRTLGILLFYSTHRNAFSPPVVALLERMARNVLFALDMFARETERKRTELALRRVEATHRTVLESIDDPYYEVDLRGSAVYHNAAFSQLLGYTAEELNGSQNRHRQTPEAAAVLFRAFNEVFRTGVAKKSQGWEYVHKNGTRGAPGA
jgi:PAS domain S-box-containing protein